MKPYYCPKCKGKWFIEYIGLIVGEVDGRKGKEDITWTECEQVYECRGCGLVVEDRGNCFKEAKVLKGK